MNNKKLLIVAALAAVWYFFIRKDPATGKPTGLPFLTPQPNSGNNLVNLPKAGANVPSLQFQTLQGIRASGGTGGGNGVDQAGGNIAPLIGLGIQGLGYLGRKTIDWLFSPKPSGDATVFQTTGPAPAGTGYNVFTNQSTAPVEVDPEPAGTVNNPYTNQSTNWGASPSMLPVRANDAPAKQNKADKHRSAIRKHIHGV